MTEITKQAYESEYYYTLKLGEQAKAYDELKQRFPVEVFGEEIIALLDKANAIAAARDPSKILDPETIRDMKVLKPDIFAKVQPIYQQFLFEKAGLAS